MKQSNSCKIENRIFYTKNKRVGRKNFSPLLIISVFLWTLVFRNIYYIRVRYIEGRYIGGHNNDEFKETRKYEVKCMLELKELTKHFGEVKAVSRR